MEARHCASELEQTLGAPVFLDSDDLTDLRELLEQVRESDVLLFFQSRSVLERPYCLLELHTAVTAGVPIVAVNVRGGNEYSHADAEHLLRYLDTELEARNPGASRLLQKHGVDLTELAHTLSGIVPNLISIEFNPSGSRLNLAASLLDIAQTMRIAKPAALDEAQEGRQAWLTARAGSPTGRRSSHGAVHAHGGRPAAVEKSSSLAPVPFEVPELPGHHEPRPAFMTRLKRALGVELSAEEEASEAEAREQRSEAEEAAAQGAARAEAQAAEASGRVTVVGMGGAGKTSIATAVARDPSVRARFERVLWVTLGQTPNLTHLQGVLCKQLKDEELTGGVSPEAARAQLARAAQGRRVLLLLDDLWDVAHERPLAILELGLPTGSRCLITTRIRGRFKGVELDLGSMAPAEALRLLLAGAGLEAVREAGADAPPDAPPPAAAGRQVAAEKAAEAAEIARLWAGPPPAAAGWQVAAEKAAAAAEIARLCGGLPLCLSVASSMMALHPMDWQTRVVQLLQGDDRAELLESDVACGGGGSGRSGGGGGGADGGEAQPATVEERVIAASLSSLPAGSGMLVRFFCGLAVFPEDLVVPVPVLDALAGMWVLDEPGARPLSHERKVSKLRKWLQTLLQHSLIKGCAAPVDRWRAVHRRAWQAGACAALP